jgi:hypothetical protein
MTEIERNRFQAPASRADTMGKVVAQIVKRNVVNQLPFGFGCLGFQGTEPVVDTRLGQPFGTL